MKYLLVLILSFCMINVSAQSIKGVVIDNETKQPIEYANIILKNKVDSSYMSGTISDINGAFSISSKDINNSYLTLSRVDYNEYFVSTLSNVDTIRVELTSAVLSLDNVVVTAARPISKMTANGLQTTVANTVLSEMGTGNDVLKRIPMVTGDKGVFEVFGRGQAKIYINNREVRNSSEVDNLNSNDIQSIEVISNPGAKYDATVSSVILIKTIKKRGDGFSLNVRSSFYTGKNQDYINQINTNYRKESLDIFANLYYTDITNLQIGDISQTVRVDTLWHQENTMDAIRHTSDLNGSLGLNYEIKEKHNIGFKYDLRTSPIGRSVDIKLKSDVYANEVLFDKWNNRELQDIHTKPESQVNMYYNGQIKDLAIEFNTDFLKGGVTTNTVNTENSEEYGERVINSTGKLSNTLWAAKLQLSYPIWKGNLMFGCEYTTISRGDQYINNELQNFSSSVNVNEQSLALFSQYQATTKVGSFSFGLRYEDAAYDYLVNNKISDEMSHRYGQWFPNASYSVRLGGVGLQLNYNSRVERPTYRQLSNNMTYGNRFTIESGNPYLTPTIKQSASLMGVWKFIQAQVSYTQKNDAIVMWINRYVQDPKVSLITYRNIDKLPALLANIAIAPTFGIWKPQLSTGVNKQWLDLTSYGVDLKLNAPMYFVSLNNIIELANSFTINIDGAYRSKGNSDLSYLYKDRFIVNCGISKSFFNKTLNIKLTMSDILNQQINALQIVAPDTDFKNLYHFDNRELSLSVRYYLNATKNRYKGKPAGQDVMNRL